MSVGSQSGGADPCRSFLSTLLSSLLIPESLRSEIMNMVMAGNAIRGLRRCRSVSDEEEYGGDPPCWAHLFDEGKDGEEPAMTASALGFHTADVVDLVEAAQEAAAQGAVWTRQSEDLNVNLLVFRAGEGVAEHVNVEVDVLLVGIAGVGTVAVNGKREMLRAGQSLVIPKGAKRGTQSLSDRFAYLTCHRRRGHLRVTQ